MHLSSLYPDTRDVLEKLNQLDFLEGYRLVGGTALALHLNHRKSIDLDFFSVETVYPERVLEVLEQNFEVTINQKWKSGMLATVNGVKFDLIRHNYPWLEEAHEFENLSIASLKDIAAMKVNAVCGRGSKKDFIDIYFLLKHFAMREMINLFEEKYSNHSKIMVYKSLLYFEDAEDDLEPEMIEPVEWLKVKSKITKEVTKLGV